MAMKVIMARDPLFEDVKKYVQQQKFASCSMIQRRFMLGFKYGESKKKADLFVLTSKMQVCRKCTFKV